jgi:cell division septation protein DedD
MKKAIILMLFALAVFTVYAQDIDRSAYAEITYDDFMAWLETEAEDGVIERFKMYLQYGGPSAPGYNFKDGDADLILASDTGLDLEEGQDVIVYFTASGPLAWDRSIDAVETDDDSQIAFSSSPSDSSDQNYPDQTYSDQSYPGSGAQTTLVPSSQRAPNSGSAQVLFPPETGRVIIEINRESNGNLRLSIEPDGASIPQNAYPPNPSRPQAVPASAFESTAPVTVTVIPRLPAAGDRKLYKVQVGAFKNKGGADQLFGKLSSAGFSPVHEKFGNWNRVIISGVRGSDVGDMARRLGVAGIETVWVRE